MIVTENEICFGDKGIEIFKRNIKQTDTIIMRYDPERVHLELCTKTMDMLLELFPDNNVIGIPVFTDIETNETPLPDVTTLTREEAIEFIKNKCNNCDRWLNCTGAEAQKCNDKIDYLVNKFKESDT